MRNVLLVTMVLVAGGCGSGVDPTPPPPPPPLPVISCPASLSADSLDGNPVQVSFTSPTVTGGDPPVATACTPAAGSNFPVGSTPITCIARDARQQISSCSFAVLVNKVPQLAATRFVAFGDSITEGRLHPCPGVSTLTYQEDLRVLSGLRPSPDQTISYPYKLRALLAGRYRAQTFTVINEGNGGESIVDGAADLPRVLSQDRPEVLLLQEGTNDINTGSPETQMNLIVGKLRDMIRLARAGGVFVFVGTLTPQRAGACRAFAPTLIAPVNDRIRAMVSGEDARLVDLYAAFGGVATADLIGPDGLHPSEAGYQKIADTFFDAIRSRLER